MNDVKNSDPSLYGLGAHADLAVTPEEDKAFAERLSASIHPPLPKPA